MQAGMFLGDTNDAMMFLGDTLIDDGTIKSLKMVGFKERSVTRPSKFSAKKNINL